MKTTLDLPDDVAAKAQSLAKANGVAFEKVLSDAVREGLPKVARETPIEAKPFHQQTHSMGWYPGMTWEKIQEILLQEEAEEYHRVEKSQ